MSIQNGVITAPVSIADVKQALGLASNDLGTLCTSNRVNMWSKKKPIKYNKIGELTDAEFKTRAENKEIIKKKINEIIKEACK